MDILFSCLKDFFDVEDVVRAKKVVGGPFNGLSPSKTRWMASSVSCAYCVSALMFNIYMELYTALIIKRPVVSLVFWSNVFDHTCRVAIKAIKYYV